MNNLKSKKRSKTKVWEVAKRNIFYLCMVLAKKFGKTWMNFLANLVGQETKAQTNLWHSQYSGNPGY